METITVLPDHLIEVILLRLPVKDLLPWKCVSKRWYALIWDDKFVKMHYRFQYAMHLAAQGDVPLLLNNPGAENTIQFHLLTKQNARDVIVNITPDFKRDSFSSNSKPWGCKMRCIGVVNGIVGLLWSTNRLALWNPATREFKDNFPCWPIERDYKNASVYVDCIRGLGFDILSNDFKVLRQTFVEWRNRRNVTTEYHLYSLKANSWKKLEDALLRTYPVLDTPETDAYFSNGVHYWISHAQDSNRMGVVAFNFSSEIFKEFELPPCYKNACLECDLIIGKYKEGLALLVDRTLESKETCIEIWAAIRFPDDDYEIYSSWELAVKISPFFELEAYRRFSIRSILDSGDVLVYVFGDKEEGDRSVECGANVYHPSTRTFHYLGIRFSSSYRYVESLFPLSRRISYTSP